MTTLAVQPFFAENVLDEIQDKSDDDYEAAWATDEDVRSRGDAARKGRYIVGTPIPLDEVQ